MSQTFTIDGSADAAARNNTALLPSDCFTLKHTSPNCVCQLQQKYIKFAMVIRLEQQWTCSPACPHHADSGSSASKACTGSLGMLRCMVLCCLRRSVAQLRRGIDEMPLQSHCPAALCSTAPSLNRWCVCAAAAATLHRRDSTTGSARWARPQKRQSSAAGAEGGSFSRDSMTRRRRRSGSQASRSGTCLQARDVTEVDHVPNTYHLHV